MSLKEKLERLVRVLPDESEINFNHNMLKIHIGESKYSFYIGSPDRLDQIIDVVEKNFKKSLTND